MSGQRLVVNLAVFDGHSLQVLHQPGESSYALVRFEVMHAVADGRNALAAQERKRKQRQIARKGLEQPRQIEDLSRSRLQSAERSE